MRGRSSSSSSIASFFYPPDEEGEEVVGGGEGGGGGGGLSTPLPSTRSVIITPTRRAPIKGGRGLLTLVDFSRQKRGSSSSRPITAMKKQDLHSTTQAGKKRVQRQFYNMLKVISLDDKHFAKPLYKDPDNAFFIMQYLEDHQSLAEIFNESYLLQPDSRWYIANELLRIVKILHGSGLAHGDIKPENIMVRVRFPGDPEKQYVDSVKFIDMESLVSSDDIEDDSCGSSGLKRTSSAPPLRTIGTIEFFPPQMKQRVIDPCFTLTLKTFIAYDLWAVGNIILALTFEGYNFPLLGKTPSPDLISKCQERLNERGFPSSLLNIDPSQRRIVNVGRGSRQRSVSY